jgi:hypothetical protein
LSGIYSRKKEEVLNKIKFLEAVSKWDNEKQTKYSNKIFWDFDLDSVKYCKEELLNIKNVKKEEEYIWFEDIRWYVNKFNHIYGINIKLKKWDKSARFVMWGDILHYKNGSVVW